MYVCLYVWVKVALHILTYRCIGIFQEAIIANNFLGFRTNPIHSIQMSVIVMKDFLHKP